MMRTLSKSKLLSFKQCPKRLWLELNQPSLQEHSAATEASFATGHQVGDIAQRLYDPKGKGELLKPFDSGFDAAFTRTTHLLGSTHPIFEASFTAGGALALADVLLPVRKAGKRAWRMVEVKSSTSVKDYHRDDAAIQAYVARAAGVPLASIALAHIDSGWVYPGGGDYTGLLVENDLSAEAFSRGTEVQSWITGAQAVARRRTPPKLSTGAHCSEPYECGFVEHCRREEPTAEFPVTWLPRVQSKALKALINGGGATDLREVPDDLLSDLQRRVKHHTLNGSVYFDAKGAAAAMASHKLPAYFLDFETVQFAVPIWKGTRPYEQLPFQFSVHLVGRRGKISHDQFLDLSGKDPRKAFAEKLIDACGESGPIFVYNAAFETSRIRELAAGLPKLRRALLALTDRIVDLLPVAQQYFYHPSQQGSWSIKKVLPAIAPDLRYDELEGVQDGGMAMLSYLEAISPATTPVRRADIERQLVAYCALDTMAMIRLWQVFTGRAPLPT